MGSPEITSDGNCACNRKFNHVLLLFLLKGVDIFHPRSSAGPKAKAAPGWQTAGSGRSLGGECFQDLSGDSAVKSVNPWSQEPEEHLFMMKYIYIYYILLYIYIII